MSWPTPGVHCQCPVTIHHRSSTDSVNEIIVLREVQLIDGYFIYWPICYPGYDRITNVMLTQRGQSTRHLWHSDSYVSVRVSRLHSCRHMLTPGVSVHANYFTLRARQCHSCHGNTIKNEEFFTACSCILYSCFIGKYEHLEMTVTDVNASCLCSKMAGLDDLL